MSADFKAIVTGYFGPITGIKMPPLATFLDVLKELKQRPEDPEALRVAHQILKENPEGLLQAIEVYIAAEDDLRTIKGLLNS